MKQVKCADLGNDCDFVAKGSVEEVMAQVADQATGVHKMTITDLSFIIRRGGGMNGIEHHLFWLASQKL